MSNHHLLGYVEGVPLHEVMLRRPDTEATRRARHGAIDPRGEWDWWWQLPPAKRRWLARWHTVASPGGVGIDELATMCGVTCDEAGSAWVDAIDSYRARRDPLDDWGDTEDVAEDADDLFGPAEMAEYFTVGLATIRQWRKRGQLPTPDLTVSSMPIWRRATVETFAGVREMLTSRAPRV